MQKSTLSMIGKRKKSFVYGLSILIFLLGFLLSSSLFWFAQYQQNNKLKYYFNLDCKERISLIELAEKELIAKMVMLRTFFPNAQLLDTPAFMNTSKELLYTEPFTSISWIEYLGEDQYRQLHRVEKQNLHPHQNTGFDSTAMMLARDNGMPFATKPFPFPGDQNHYCLQIFVPIYQGEGLANVMQRRANHLGFISSTVDLKLFFEDVLNQSYPKGLHTRIYDLESEDQPLLISDLESRFGSQDRVIGSGMQFEGEILIAGRLFMVEILPTSTYIRQETLFLPILLFLLGLLIVILFTMFIFRMLNYQESIELLLQKRTRLIHANQELYRSTLNSIGEALLSVDCNGIVTAMNPSAEKLSGWKEEEVLGHHFFEVLHLIDSQTGKIAQNPLVNALKEQKTLCIPHGITLTNRKGEQIYLTVSGSPILNAEGALVGGVMVFRDIGTEYEIRRDLQQSEEMFKAIAHRAMDAIILINQAGKIIFWNKAAEKQFQYTAAEVLYRDVHQMIAPMNYHEKAWAGFQAYQKDGKGPVVDTLNEMEGSRKDGSVFPLELRVSPVMIKGERHTIGIIRDISHQKLAREAIENKNIELQLLNERKNELLGLTTHDIRNPISVIKGYADLLLEDNGKKLSREQAKMIEKIQDSASFVAKLLNDLLDFSALESGKLKMNLRTESFTDFMDHAIQNIALMAYEKKIRIDTEIDEDLPEFPFDRNRIEQVMQNLISNAVKFSLPDTTIKVTVWHEEERVHVSISDQGQGIPEEELDKLFRPFQKTSVKPTAGEKSTGLGLVIAQNIIQAHGGDLWVESKVGLGSTFTFTLPF